MTAALGGSGRSSRWERVTALCLLAGRTGREPSGLMDQQMRREMTQPALEHRQRFQWGKHQTTVGTQHEELTPRLLNSRPRALF